MEVSVPETVQVTEAFAGFPGLAIGGYVCGLAGRHLGPHAEVSLRQPVRVGTTLTIEVGDQACLVRHDDEIVAEGRRRDSPLELPPDVDTAQAEAAARLYSGFRVHLFPHCFTCGPARPESQGLRIFPGPVASRDLVACTWTPRSWVAAEDGGVRPEVLWAALDCPAIWALIEASSAGSTERAVTGTMALDLKGAVLIDQTYVVVGWPLGREGRKLFAGAAICSVGGQPLVVARQTMIVTERGVPLSLQGWQT